MGVIKTERVGKMVAGWRLTDRDGGGGGGGGRRRGRWWWGEGSKSQGTEKGETPLKNETEPAGGLPQSHGV